MDLIGTLSISASGLSAQRLRLQTVAANLANARTTRTEEGGPYTRKLPVFEAEQEPFAGALERHMARVRVVEVRDSTEPPVMVYDPGHPDAGPDGYVACPNVDVLEEMVDLLTTARSYEANTQAVAATRQMANAALEIGK